MATIFELLLNNGAAWSISEHYIETLDKNLSENFVKVDNFKLYNLLISNLCDIDSVDCFHSLLDKAKNIVYSIPKDKTKPIEGNVINPKVHIGHAANIPHVLTEIGHYDFEKYEKKYLSMTFYPKTWEKFDANHEIGFEIRMFYDLKHGLYQFEIYATKKLMDNFKKYTSFIFEELENEGEYETEEEDNANNFFHQIINNILNLKTL